MSPTIIVVVFGIAVVAYSNQICDERFRSLSFMEIKNSQGQIIFECDGDCIFCKIVAGQLESSKVYEDDEIVALMDIQPVRPGQVLVIPKEHIDHFSDIPDALALKIYTKTHSLLKAVREVVHPERMGLVVHGYGVPHAHVVIVPQHHEDDITSGRMADIENGRVIFTTKKLPLVPREELDQMAQLIKKATVS